MESHCRPDWKTAEGNHSNRGERRAAACQKAHNICSLPPASWLLTATATSARKYFERNITEYRTAAI